MSRFDNRPKIQPEQNTEPETEKKLTAPKLRGRKAIINKNGKEEKEKVMFYLPKTLVRALQIYAFENRKNNSEVCKVALENIIPKEVIDRALSEFRTI